MQILEAGRKVWDEFFSCHHDVLDSDLTEEVEVSSTGTVSNIQFFGDFSCICGEKRVID